MKPKTTDLSISPNTCDLTSGGQSLASSIIAKIQEDGVVVNLKPSSQSSSSAVVESGKTKITQLEKLRDGSLIVKTSNGLFCSRQNKAGPTIKSYAKNLLTFTGVDRNTIIDDSSPTHGLYESVSGKKIVLLGYKTPTATGIECGTVIIDGTN